MSPVVEGGGGAAAEAEWPCKRHRSQGFRGALDEVGSSMAQRRCDWSGANAFGNKVADGP